MQNTLHYNVDTIISVKSFGFEDSWYEYIPQKTVTSWFWIFTNEVEEHIAGVFGWYPYPVSLFFDNYPNYIFSNDDKILRKPRIELTFTDSDSTCITYENEEDMNEALEDIIKIIPRTLECNL